MRLSLEADALLTFHALSLFNVDGDREPHTGLNIQTPAVEVEVVLGRIFAGRVRVSAVEAHNVANLIFNPDASIEAALAVDLGMHIEDPGANGSKKLAAHIAEFIMLRVEARRIDEHHLHEAVRIIGKLFEPQSLGQTRDRRERTLEPSTL